jgi:hypothetical protein
LVSVSVDVKSIRSQVRRFGDALLLLARSEPVLDVEVVRAAAVAAMPEESTPWIGSVMVIPAGVVVGLEGPADDIVSFVDAFAGELRARTDAEVSLGAARPQNQPRWMQDSVPLDDCVSAWMVHHLSDRPNEPWAVGEEDTRRLAAVVAVELEPSEVTTVTIDAELTLNYSGVSIADAAPELLKTNNRISFAVGRRSPLHSERAYFIGPGIVSVWLGRPTDASLGVVAAGRRMLVASAESAVYGAVLVDRPLSHPEGLPFVGSGNYFRWSRHWDRVVPDVYGVQVLGPKHLEHVKDLSGWVSTRLDGGRFLVEARDLGAWYEGVPDPDLLAAARVDFGGIIFTAELMRQLPSDPLFERLWETAAREGTLAGGRG